MLIELTWTNYAEFEEKLSKNMNPDKVAERLDQMIEQIKTVLLEACPKAEITEVGETYYNWNRACLIMADMQPPRASARALHKVAQAIRSAYLTPKMADHDLHFHIEVSCGCDDDNSFKMAEANT